MNLSNPILVAFITFIWGSAIWVWRYRNRLDDLNQYFPLIRRYRKGRLYPLFRSREDVLAFAGWLVGVGVLFFTICISN